MCETIDGVYQNSIKQKKNLYSIKRNLLVNKYYSKKSNKEFDILKQLKQATKNLKLIENIDYISDLELKKYNSTSTHTFLWQEKIVNEFKLFITMLGFIDGEIDDIERQISFHTTFNNLEQIEYLNEDKLFFLEIRKNILNNYNKINKKKDPRFIDEIIEYYPSHKYFNRFYEDIMENRYGLNLQIEFINAYNFGYTKEGKVNFNYIYSEYIKLYNELNNYKEEKNNKIKKIKR